MSTKVKHNMTEGIYSKTEVDMMFQYGVALVGEVGEFATIAYVDSANGNQDFSVTTTFSGDQLVGEAEEFATVTYVDEGNDDQDDDVGTISTGIQLAGEL